MLAPHCMRFGNFTLVDGSLADIVAKVSIGIAPACITRESVISVANTCSFSLPL